jgi:parvulin-like peptidyl-prolyl isomerase
MYRQWLLAISIFLGVVVVGLVGYAIYDYAVIRPNTVVATIDGEEITSQEFTGWARMAQADLVNQIEYLSISAQYGLIGPDQLPQVQQQVDMMVAQLDDENLIAQLTLDRIVESLLVQQELEALEIEVDEADVARQMELSFNFLSQGTATPLPSNTPDVERTSIYETALATQGWETATTMPSATATLEESPLPEVTEASPEATVAAASPAASPTPQPTATEFTREGYEQLYRDTIAEWEGLAVPEEIFRFHLLRSFYSELLIDYFETQVEAEVEQILASHILVDSEETAQVVLDALEEGQHWESLAATYSMDFNTSFFGGDIGWNTLEDLVGRYTFNVGIAAFAAEPGSIVGPIPAPDGVHMFWVLDRSIQPLNPAQLEAAAQTAYNTWLTEARSTVEIEILSELSQWVPSYAPLVQQ